MDILATLDDESNSDSDGDVIEGRVEVENAYGNQSGWLCYDFTAKNLKTCNSKIF